MISRRQEQDYYVIVGQLGPTGPTGVGATGPVGPTGVGATGPTGPSGSPITTGTFTLTGTAGGNGSGGSTYTASCEYSINGNIAVVYIGGFSGGTVFTTAGAESAGSGIYIGYSNLPSQLIPAKNLNIPFANLYLNSSTGVNCQAYIYTTGGINILPSTEGAIPANTSIQYPVGTVLTYLLT